MEIKPLFVILVDISGYTEFIRLHKFSLIHAEAIIIDLLEAVLDKAEFPVVTHEILGDAVSFYAEVEKDDEGLADYIYQQVQEFFDAFKEREAELVSECSICVCDACRQVEQLKLKAILHRGKAAFGEIKGMKKISGEDVILAHRLLKNSVPVDEYILMSQAFFSRCSAIGEEEICFLSERYPKIGEVQVAVKYFEPVDVTGQKRPFWQKMKRSAAVEAHLFSRLLGLKKPKLFRNLPP